MASLLVTVMSKHRWWSAAAQAACRHCCPPTWWWPEQIQGRAACLVLPLDGSHADHSQVLAGHTVPAGYACHLQIAKHDRRLVRLCVAGCMPSAQDRSSGPRLPHAHTNGFGQGSVKPCMHHIPDSARRAWQLHPAAKQQRSDTRRSRPGDPVPAARDPAGLPQPPPP